MISLGVVAKGHIPRLMAIASEKMFRYHGIKALGCTHPEREVRDDFERQGEPLRVGWAASFLCVTHGLRENCRVGLSCSLSPAVTG